MIISFHVDDEEPTILNPNSVFQEIIDLFEKYSPSYYIRILLHMRINVYIFTSKLGEEVSIYAHRFQILALYYLNHYYAVVAEQYIHKFCMILFQNSKISLISMYLYCHQTSIDRNSTK